MNGETLLAEAIEMKDEIVENRRAIHRAPEVGVHLPQTVQFVEEKLRLLGYEPRELGGGVVAELTGEDMGRCILLRADMDALKVREKTDLPFRSENGSMHACGHDMHAAMLLGAARLLKAHQSELKGTVKLVFQPDEEGFTGAKAMLKAGVLEAPEPQAAMALHVNSGTPSGLVLCAWQLRSYKAVSDRQTPSRFPWRKSGRSGTTCCQRRAWLPFCGHFCRAWHSCREYGHSGGHLQCPHR